MIYTKDNLKIGMLFRSVLSKVTLQVVAFTDDEVTLQTAGIKLGSKGWDYLGNLSDTNYYIRILTDNDFYEELDKL